MRCKGEPTAMPSQCAISSDFELLRHWSRALCIVRASCRCCGMQLACTAHAAYMHTARRAPDTAHTKRATRHGSGPLRGTRFGSGSLFGVYDTRNFGKFLCCVPRHPQCEKSYVCPGYHALRCRTALPRTTAHCFRACMLARARGRALPAPPRCRRVAIGANRRWSARQVPARAAADAAVARGVQVPQAGSPTPPDPAWRRAVPLRPFFPT